MLLHAFGEDAPFAAAELPDPVAAPGEVVVRIVATSVNPIEGKLRRHGGAVAPELPALLGSDFAGRVIAVGGGVERFGIGDAVFGYAGGVRGWPGAYAEKVAVDAQLVAPAPRSIPLEHCAALPLAGLTAAEALDRSRVAAGDRVLVLGATGGVGHLAVQMASALGASVHAGVGSTASVDRALALGAAGAFDARSESPGGYAARVTGGAGFDALIDCTPGVELDSLYVALRDGGQLVSLVTRRACDLGGLSRKALSLHAIFVPGALLAGTQLGDHAARLERLSGLVESGLLTPQIDSRRFALDEIGEAHALFENGRPEGRILVTCGF